MQEMKFCQYCEGKDFDIIVSFESELGRIKCVKCRQCGACGPIADNDEMAILKWNSRIQEVPGMPQERPTIIKADKYDKFGCPIRGSDKPCNGRWCMMWVCVGENKGRCGLVNTIYGTTGCGVVQSV